MISFHTYLNGYYLKKAADKFCKDVEKLEPLYTFGGNLEWYSHSTAWKYYGGFSKYWK